MKGTKIEVADDPETIRHKQNTHVSWNKIPEKANFCKIIALKIQHISKIQKKINIY